jgi:hypothetical protein
MSSRHGYSPSTVGLTSSARINAVFGEQPDQKEEAREKNTNFGVYNNGKDFFGLSMNSMCKNVILILKLPTHFYHHLGQAD